MLLDAPSSTQMAACKNEQCFKSSMNYSSWNDTIKHAFHFLGLYLIWSWIFDTADALVFQAIVWIYRLCSMISIHRPTDSPRDIASTNAVCDFCFSLMIATVFLRSNSEPLQEACSVVCHGPKPGFGWIWRMPFPSFPIHSVEFEWIQCFWAYITYRLIVSYSIILYLPELGDPNLPIPRIPKAENSCGEGHDTGAQQNVCLLLVKLEGFKKGLTVDHGEPLQMSQVNSPGSTRVITILPL